MSSWPSESALLHLMEDDRLRLRVHEIEADLQTEVDYVSNIPDSIWSLVSHVLQCPARFLANETIKSVHVQVGFCADRFRPAKCLPWSLVAGDVNENINKLSTGPEPANWTAQNNSNTRPFEIRQRSFAGCGRSAREAWMDDFGSRAGAFDHADLDAATPYVLTECRPGAFLHNAFAAVVLHDGGGEASCEA